MLLVNQGSSSAVWQLVPILNSSWCHEVPVQAVRWWYHRGINGIANSATNYATANVISIKSLGNCRGCSLHFPLAFLPSLVFCFLMQLPMETWQPVKHDGTSVANSASSSDHCHGISETASNFSYTDWLTVMSLWHCYITYIRNDCSLSVTVFFKQKTNGWS